MASKGFSILIALIGVFVIGLIWIPLNQVFTNYLFNSTVMTSVMNTFPNGNMTAVTETITKMTYAWTAIPILIIIALVIFVIVKAQTGDK